MTKKNIVCGMISLVRKITGTNTYSEWTYSDWQWFLVDHVLKQQFFRWKFQILILQFHADIHMVLIDHLFSKTNAHTHVLAHRFSEPFNNQDIFQVFGSVPEK